MAKQQGAKGCPPPKKTPAWSRYKNENRFYHHQVKQIVSHLDKYPNDKQSASALQSLKDKHLGIK